jgi:hypothetical protein
MVMDDKNQSCEGTKNNGTKVTAVVSAGANDAGGAGLSRAAKRRKKRVGTCPVSRHRAANAVTVTPVVKSTEQAQAAAAVCKQIHDCAKPSMLPLLSVRPETSSASRHDLTRNHFPLLLCRHGLDQTDRLARHRITEFGHAVKALP